ncbi:MAG: methyltransferase domain-containing protein [Candidatus Marinimicrobia bacterium]|nr:methyltransferase domain-containing protein [Candidatus Neomarinimicrobiota bacterium]
MLITLKQLEIKIAKKSLKLTPSLEKEYNLFVEKINQREAKAQKESSLEITNREGGDATLVNQPLLSAIHLSNYLAVTAIIKALVKKKSDLNKLKILGVGEGSGAFAYYLSSALQPQTYLATDYQQGLVDYGQAVFGEGYLSFSPLDATKMAAIKNHSFDVIVASEFIEHIPTSNLVAFLKQSRRVLKKGGVLLATTPNKGCHPGKVYSGYPHHFTEFTAQELDDLIKTHLAQVFCQEAIFYLVNRKIGQEKRRRLPLELVVNRLFGLFLKLIPKESQREKVLDKLLTNLLKTMKKEVKRKKLTFPREYDQTTLTSQPDNPQEAFGLCLVLQA